MNRKNMCNFEGKLTKDPVVHKLNRSLNDGQTKTVDVCNFILAVEGGRDGESDEVYFLKCETWDTAALAMMEYRKGDVIFVQGNMKNKRWVDKKTNETRHEDVLRVQHFIPVYINNSAQIEV